MKIYSWVGQLLWENGLHHNLIPLQHTTLVCVSARQLFTLYSLVVNWWWVINVFVNVKSFPLVPRKIDHVLLISVDLQDPVLETGVESMLAPHYTRTHELRGFFGDMLFPEKKSVKISNNPCTYWFFHGLFIVGSFIFSSFPYFDPKKKKSYESIISFLISRINWKLEILTW